MQVPDQSINQARASCYFDSCVGSSVDTAFRPEIRKKINKNKIK